MINTEFATFHLIAACTNVAMLILIVSLIVFRAVAASARAVEGI